MAEPAPSKPEQQDSDAPSVGHWKPSVILQADAVPPQRIPEIGGRKDGPEPTRYGDWEKNGRCIDF
jgi:hypothetical protein